MMKNKCIVWLIVLRNLKAFSFYILNYTSVAIFLNLPSLKFGASGPDPSCSCCFMESDPVPMIFVKIKCGVLIDEFLNFHNMSRTVF